MEWLAVGIVVVGLMFGFGEAWAETRGPEAREHWLRQLVTEVYPDAVVVLGQPTSIPPHGVTVRTVRRGKVELRVALDQPTRNDDASEPIAGLDPNQALLSSEAKAMCLPAASASLATVSPKPQPERALVFGRVRTRRKEAPAIAGAFLFVEVQPRAQSTRDARRP